MKFSGKAERCRLSPMRKFHPYAVAAEQRGRTIYHLNIGQPDIQTPAAYFEAVRDFRPPVLAYAPSPGMPALIAAVRRYYDALGIQLTDADILVTAGGSEALSIALSCILDEGDEVLIPEPFYPNYNTFVEAAGGRIRPIPTRPETGYRYAERAAVEARITGRTRAILVSNPGNPTGSVLSQAEMRLLADLAVEHGLFLIADEVYREFVYGASPPGSFAQFADASDRVILIDSVSKRFSACGARVGMLISRNSAFMGHAMKFCQSRLSVATLDQVAAAALYDAGPGYFSAVRDEYRRRRDTVMTGLSHIPGVVCSRPEGAFYVMAKLPVGDTEAFQQWLLERFEDRGETVMFAPGSGFYATPGAGADEIRIAYVLRQADLERAMELLALAIGQYRAERG